MIAPPVVGALPAAGVFLFADKNERPAAMLLYSLTCNLGIAAGLFIMSTGWLNVDGPTRAQKQALYRFLLNKRAKVKDLLSGLRRNEATKLIDMLAKASDRVSRERENNGLNE